MTYSASENLIRHISLRQLQIFEAVVRLGGYTRAAEALHLTQPTVSMQVKKLSTTIGHPLLEKVGRHLQTTAVGDEVYASAQSVLGSMVSLSESAAALEGVVKGPLRVAVITTAKYFMPHLLGAFITQHPEVRPILKVTNRSRVLEHPYQRDWQTHDYRDRCNVPKIWYLLLHHLSDSQLKIPAASLPVLLFALFDTRTIIDFRQREQ